MTKTEKKDLATSFTTFTFIVIAISGVMMFFHFFDNYVENLHEILGLLFIVVVLFHVVYNFKSMKNYFSKKIFGLSALGIVMVSLIFILNAKDGHNPKKAMIVSMLNAPIENTLIVLEKDFTKAKTKLELKGFFVTKYDTIKSIADKNDVSPFEVVDTIIQE